MSPSHQGRLGGLATLQSLGEWLLLEALRQQHRTLFQARIKACEVDR